MEEVTLKRRVIGKTRKKCDERVLKLIQQVAEKCLPILGGGLDWADYVLNFNIKKEKKFPVYDEWAVHYARDESYFPEQFGNVYQTNFVHMMIVPLRHFDKDDELKLEKDKWWIEVSCHDGSISEWRANPHGMKVPVDRDDVPKQHVKYSHERALDLLEFVGDQLIRAISSSDDFAFAVIPINLTTDKVNLQSLLNWRHSMMGYWEKTREKAKAKAGNSEKTNIEENDDQTGLGGA